MGYWYHGWANRIEKIASIDTQNKKITLAKSPSYGIAAKKPYYVLNLLEEIDRPGEWYLDRRKASCTCGRPRASRRATCCSPRWPDRPLAQEHLADSHRGTHCSKPAPAAASKSRGRTISSPTAPSGMCGPMASPSPARGTASPAARSPASARRASPSPAATAPKLIPGENFVRNCRIHNFGRWERTYAPAIRLNGVGNIAANNLLYDGPHSAILFGGNEHLIELNEIHGVCYEVDDAGSIYCGRDWGLRGNIIRHNFFHHIKSSLPGSNGVHAVYLDDCASGITVFGNTFYEISGRAIMCGGGRDNTIENNVIAKCGSAHFTDRRGKAWIDKDESWKLLDKIKRYNYTQPPWSTRYPELAHILDNGYEQAKEPEGCVIARNLGWQNKRWLEKNSLGGSGGFDFYTIEQHRGPGPALRRRADPEPRPEGRLPCLLDAGLPADSLREHRAPGQ